MKIQIISDTHLEFRESRDLPLIRADVDYIIFAGDIATTAKEAEEFFSNIRNLTTAKFIYVLGNHEFYGNVHPYVISEYIDVGTSVDDLYVLDQGSVAFKDHNVRFIGATGWTSYRNGQEQAAAEIYMNDFRTIQVVDDDGRYDYINSRYIRAEHTRHKLFFDAHASREIDEQVIVVSHHAPGPRSIHPKFAGSLMNGAYYEDLRSIIHSAKPTMWIHGHTHMACNYLVGDTLVVCNPMGYPFEHHNGFIDGLMLNIDKDGISQAIGEEDETGELPVR